MSRTGPENKTTQRNKDDISVVQLKITSLMYRDALYLQYSVDFRSVFNKNNNSLFRNQHDKTHTYMHCTMHGIIIKKY